MNVVDRICNKYPIEYNLMPDPRMRLVNLMFGSKVPLDLQDQILDRMDWLGIYTDDTGIRLTLDISADQEDVYTLRCPNQVEYHYSRQPIGIPFLNYSVVDAISWTIYVVACRENWLDDYAGKFITARCFSARQQSAAVQIKKSIDLQRNNLLSREQVEDVFHELCDFISDIAAQAPRYSAQPIKESAFDRFKNRQTEIELYDLSEMLFDNISFDTEVERYIQMVKESALYARRLEQAVSRLTEVAYDIPILAVERLFTELGTMIDEIEPANVSDVNALLREKVRFSLSRLQLKSCFEKIDRIFLYAVEERLQRDFLTAVREQTRSLIHKEFSLAKREINIHAHALDRFCFVSSQHFAQDDSTARILNWKKLSALAERDIFSKDVSWAPQSLHDLQSTLKARHAPQVWICSRKLRNIPECDDITDALITKPAPILGEWLVWAIWADVSN